MGLLSLAAADHGDRHGRRWRPWRPAHYWLRSLRYAGFWGVCRSRPDDRRRRARLRVCVGLAVVPRGGGCTGSSISPGNQHTRATGANDPRRPHDHYLANPLAVVMRFMSITSVAIGGRCGPCRR
jgi:hypothetical protein